MATPMVSAWLDALAAGEMDQGGFLREVSGLVKSAPDEAWEVLSILDQYYRRGKINPEVFQYVKTTLSNRLMGMEDAAAVKSVQAAVPIPIPVAIPVAVPVPVPVAVPGARSVTVAAGDVLRGRYRVTRIIVTGPDGTVLEAVDEYLAGVPESRQRLAIQLFPDEVGRNPAVLRQCLAKFAICRSLAHPNILHVYEFDRDGGYAFVAMELLQGATLQRLLSTPAGPKWDRVRAYGLIQDVAAAVGYAHSRHIIHGAIEPRRIFITDSGELRVLGFGGVSTARPAAFAACEMSEGQPADTRSDVFAIACVAYWVLAGSRPFGGLSAVEARDGGVEPVRPPGLADEQWRALQEGLRFARDQRPAGVAVWVQRLMPSASGLRLVPVPVAPPATMPGRPILPIAAGGIAATVLIAALGWWLNRAPTPASERAPAPAAPAPAAPLPPAVSIAAAPTLRTHAAPTVAPAVSTGAESAAVPTAPAVTVAATTIAAEPQPPVTARRPAEASMTVTPSRIELTSALVDVDPGESVARVEVRRRGNTRGVVSFHWWTESGTAKPLNDFAPVSERTEKMEDGKAAVSLYIPVVVDSLRAEQRSFYVLIDQPGDGAVLGARTMTMVTLPGPAGAGAP